MSNSLKTRIAMKLATNRLSAFRSAWRLARDLSRTMDAAIVQVAYSRSSWCRKMSRWDEITAAMAAEHPVVAEAVRERRRVSGFDFAALRELPEGTLGRVFADHVASTNIDPGMLPPFTIDSDADYLFVHFVETHDLWHVVSGFGVDDLGEMSIAGFTAAQMGNAPHFAMVVAIILLNTAFVNPETFGPRMEALTNGWRVGREAKTLVGADWASLWDKPLDEVRRMFDLPMEPTVVGLGLGEAPPNLARAV